MTSITEKTIALAGVFQAAALVNQIAAKGIVDEHDLKTAIQSILNLEPRPWMYLATMKICAPDSTP